METELPSQSRRPRASERHEAVFYGALGNVVFLSLAALKLAVTCCCCMLANRMLWAGSWMTHGTAERCSLVQLLSGLHGTSHGSASGI